MTNRATLILAYGALSFAIGGCAAGDSEAETFESSEDALTFSTSSGTPGWIIRCDYSHSLADDPIVAFARPSASHLHDFIGNKSTNAFSTFQSMIGASTNCVVPEDLAGYWTPSIYKNGGQVRPTGPKPNGGRTSQNIYYRRSSSARVTTPPPDFRMIAGNAKATSEAENPKLGKDIYWGCSDNSTGKLKAPPSSCPEGTVSLHVGFPSCWNGRDVDTPDHMSHVAYPSSGVCPSTHPVPIPRIILRWEYPVGSSTGAITLSSGPAYTAHGDFWNTWKQDAFERLVNDCLNAGVSCGKPGP